MRHVAATCKAGGQVLLLDVDGTAEAAMRRGGRKGGRPGERDEGKRAKSFSSLARAAERSEVRRFGNLDSRIGKENVFKIVPKLVMERKSTKC